MKFAFALLWLIRLLPMWAIGLLARGLGNVAYCLARDRRRVGMINLRLCFPEMPVAERRRLIRRNFQHMIRSPSSAAALQFPADRQQRRRRD